MAQRFLIYGLVDPRSAELRYVGKSSSGLQRPKQHWTTTSLKKRSHNASWIAGLLGIGLRPEIVVLEEYENDPYLCEIERLAIAHYRSRGFRLTNMTDGGEGTAGFRPSAASIEKRAAKMRGRKLPPKTPEYFANYRKARLGVPVKPFSAEHRAKLSAALRGRKLNPEHRAKAVVARLGIPHTAETRARMAAAHRGQKRGPLSPEHIARIKASKAARRKPRQLPLL